MKAPCKDCTERHFACHDGCPKYKTYRKALDDINAKRQAHVEKERFYFAVRV